jgi:hypothetical protein
MSSEVFPWPEFKMQQVFSEMVRFQIKGMASEEGNKYLKHKMKNEEF